MGVKGSQVSAQRNYGGFDTFSGQRAVGSGASLHLKKFKILGNLFLSSVKMCSSGKLIAVENLSSHVSSTNVKHLKTVLCLLC